MRQHNVGFTIFGVPYWGPEYRGILLFGDLYGAIFVNPHVQTGTTVVWEDLQAPSPGPCPPATGQAPD